MRIIEDIAEMAECAEQARSARHGAAKTIVLVPTMGSLHRGHIELVRRARKEAGKEGLTIVSIFVNPKQFGPGEDYEKYPRSLDEDLEKLAAEGVDIVFHPEPSKMYQERYATFVEVEGLSEKLCGASRPGHFRGVTTVVAKLFSIIRPHKAVFGLKDFQQQLIIRRMVRDLNLGVEVLSLPTVREADGLAMSSRNGYLGEDERGAAACIPRAMEAAQRAYASGVRNANEVLAEAKKIMENEPLVVLDYLRLCETDTLDDVEVVGEDKDVLLAVAAMVGSARLIDNCLIGQHKETPGGSKRQ